MIPIDAVELALARFQDPQAHQDQFEASAPLPSGMDRLLALATGSPWLLEEAALDAWVTADVLRQAVLDLIPQICFADNASYYRTLGLDPEASSQQIKDHYRLLLLLYHPDRAETRDCAERFTVRLNQAYSTLSKPQSRALYDDVLQQSGSLASTVEWQPEESDLDTETFGDRLKTAIRSRAEQLFGHRTEMWWVMPGLVVMVGLVFLGQTTSVPDTEAGVVAQIAQPTQDLANHRPAGSQESKPNSWHDRPGPVPVPETVAVAPPSEPMATVDGEPPVVEQALDFRAIDSMAPLVVAPPTVSGSESSVTAPAPETNMASDFQPLQTVTATSLPATHTHQPVTAVSMSQPPVNHPIVATPATEQVTKPIEQLAMQPMQPMLAGSKPAYAVPIRARVASETRQIVEPVPPKMVDPQLVRSFEESTEPAVTPVRPAHRPKPSGVGATTQVSGQRPERPTSRAILAGMAPAASARSTASQALPRQSRTTSSVLTTGEVDDLFANYGSAIRSGDLNRVMALFAPDACGPDDRDRDAIRQSYAQLLDSNRIRRLQLSNTHSSLRGDGATAIACSVLWLRNRETGTMYQSIGPIRLDLEKRDGRVLITATDQNWLSPPKPTSELTTQEIEEQVERYAEAFRSGDLNRVMGLIKPMDCCNGEADRQAIRRPYAELFGSYMVRRMQLSDIRWDICGDAANVETRYEVWLKRRGNGQPSHRTGTIRLDLQRRDGQIVIVNVEHSWQAS